MKKYLFIPSINQNIKIEENIFDYKITFTSSLATSISYVKRKKAVDVLVRYDSSAYRSKAKILEYTKNNDFNYFATITIDSKKADISDYDGIRKKICKYFNNIKNRYDSNFKYILVAEKGSRKGRLHFHGLVCISNNKLLKHVKSGLYRNDYLFVNLGANQFKKIDSYTLNCALYLTKYLTKDNIAIELYSRYYFCSKGLNCSKNITHLFDLDSLQSLFNYCCSCGLLSSGRYADTMVVNSDFLFKYLINKNELEKKLA